jgi:hypothetical protein
MLMVQKQFGEIVDILFKTIILSIPCNQDGPFCAHFSAFRPLPQTAAFQRRSKSCRKKNTRVYKLKQRSALSIFLRLLTRRIFVSQATAFSTVKVQNQNRPTVCGACIATLM